MPNIKSATKRMHLSRAQNLRNRAKRSRIRTAIKRVRSAETAEVGQKALHEVVILLDRAATKNLVHANTVARMKSSLTRHVNSLS